jgi:hypothetical protein
MNAPFSITTGEAMAGEPRPIDLDPRTCRLCGLTIDGHEMIDEGEGPLFFCAGSDVAPADIVRQWEMADPRDRWHHTGEAPPPERVRNSDILATPADKPQPYRTPQATRDAFWYVVGLAEPERLKAWLADHPRDARYLIKLLESR